jgi:mannan endo-1,4-beta-mannosidase
MTPFREAIRMPRHLLLPFAALLLLANPQAHAQHAGRAAAPIDSRATRETQDLLANMHRIAPTRTMFGHQNTLAYGYGWTGEPHRSDVKDVTGSFPQVYGWDVMDIFAPGDARRLDPAKSARLRAFVQEARARGGVNSFSWHMPNPVKDSDAWDTTPAVAAILPGGAQHARYKAQLDIAADFFKSLTDAHGAPIPVWFRPFHEQTGTWFWWGKGHVSPEDFKALWRFTVRYLRDTRGVHNLLYAFSTDVFDDQAGYFEFYPGDDYVDLLGFDDYHSIATPATLGIFVSRLENVARWARARGKLAALTETGLEALPDPNWWTGTLLPGLDANADTRAISYVLVWRNANPANDRKEHFYAPYPGQKSAADFLRFRRDPLIAFEGDVGDLYADPRTEPQRHP